MRRRKIYAFYVPTRLYYGGLEAEFGNSIQYLVLKEQGKYFNK
jgi:hypothetical protein